MRAIAVINLKGGSAKTTTALALAVGFAAKLPKKQRLLLVDADPQANATLIMLDGQQAKAPTLTDVLLGKAEPTDAIRNTRIPNLDLLPANASLANCPTALLDELGPDRRLRRGLRPVEDRYACAVIDASPAWNLISINVMQAVREIVVPVDVGLFSIAGLSRLQEAIEQVRRHLEHPELSIVALAIVKALRTKGSKELERQLRELYGPLVCKTVIPFSSAVEDAHAHLQSILEWAPRSPAGLAYGQLATEVQNGNAKKRLPRRHGPQRSDDAA
jgi:chromosome partitioning protein